MAKDKLIEKIHDIINDVSLIDFLVNNLLDEAEKLPDDKLAIKDIKNFKWRLELEHLLTPQLENFIDEYMKFYNTDPKH